MQTTWQELISSVIEGKDLSSEQAQWAMDQVMQGETSPILLAGFLTALAAKGETSEEVHGLAQSMLAHAKSLNIDADVLDIVGTGGDRLQTVNISTAASIVIAAGGVPVIKHGNRASSSASGSADCLEAWGVKIDLTSEQVREVFEKTGISFVFANVFHPSMRFAAPARKELGVRTAFNLLGPLTNPARPGHSVIGVASQMHAPLVAEVLAKNTTHSLVFRGENGMDEITATATNRVWEVYQGQVHASTLDAVAQLGCAPARVEDLRGGDGAYNAALLRRVFEGEKGELTPIREAVLLNAAAGFVAYETGDEIITTTLAERLSRGFEKAQDVIDSGKALAKLEEWVRVSNHVA